MLYLIGKFQGKILQDATMFTMILIGSFKWEMKINSRKYISVALKSSSLEYFLRPLVRMVGITIIFKECKKGHAVNKYCGSFKKESTVIDPKSKGKGRDSAGLRNHHQTWMSNEEHHCWKLGTQTK